MQTPELHAAPPYASRPAAWPAAHLTAAPVGAQQLQHQQQLAGLLPTSSATLGRRPGLRRAKPSSAGPGTGPASWPPDQRALWLQLDQQLSRCPELQAAEVLEGESASCTAKSHAAFGRLVRHSETCMHVLFRDVPALLLAGAAGLVDWQVARARAAQGGVSGGSDGSSGCGGDAGAAAVASSSSSSLAPYSYPAGRGQRRCYLCGGSAAGPAPPSGSQVCCRRACRCCSSCCAWCRAW